MHRLFAAGLYGFFAASSLLLFLGVACQEARGGLMLQLIGLAMCSVLCVIRTNDSKITKALTFMALIVGIGALISSLYNCAIEPVAVMALVCDLIGLGSWLWASKSKK